MPRKVHSGEPPIRQPRLETACRSIDPGCCGSERAQAWGRFRRANKRWLIGYAGSFVSGKVGGENEDDWGEE